MYGTWAGKGISKQTGSRSSPGWFGSDTNQLFFYTFNNPLKTLSTLSKPTSITSFKMEHLNPDEKANKIRGLHA
jgi:hypothetical protein